MHHLHGLTHQQGNGDADVAEETQQAVMIISRLVCLSMSHMSNTPEREVPDGLPCRSRKTGGSALPPVPSRASSMLPSIHAAVRAPL